MFRKFELILPIKTSSISLPAPYSLARITDCELQPLKNNIAENGIISPLTVREIGKGHYEVICGKRRLICARMLGFKTVPCIKVTADCTTAKIMSLSETLSFRSPDFFELAAALSDIIVNGNTDADTVRYRLGLSESFLYSKLELLKLSDEIKRRIKVSGLTERHASLLLRLPPEMRSGALDRMIADQLDEREASSLVDSLLTPKPEPPKPMRKASIGDLRLFSNSLSKMLSTLSFAGYEPTFSEKESEKYVDYSIRLRKKPDTAEYYQMPIC